MAWRAYEAGTNLEVMQDRGAFVLPTSDVPVYGIEIVENTDIIGSLAHVRDRAPMLDSGSMLHIAPLSYG